VPCLVGCLALLSPRIALVLVWLFGGNYLARAYDTWLFVVLGFLFLPLTTLAFAYGMNSLGQPGQMPPLGWLLVALAAAADLGLIGGGGRSAQRWQSERYQR
jgi:purine-cytosine permease-like protein